MEKFYNIVVSKEEADKAEKMIRWFSHNVRKEDHKTTVCFHAVLDENGMENVKSSLKS